MFIYNPENFDPEPILPGYEDYVRLFVHYVLLQRYKYDDNEFAPLKASILIKEIHSIKTKTIKEALIKHKVIECDKIYAKGLKCFGFRMTKKYLNQKVISIKILNRKILTNKHKHDLYINKEITNKTHLAIFNNVKQIKIDYNKANQYLINNSDNVDNTDCKWMSLEKINNKDWFFHVDERGRVYHNVTTLWKEFRQFVSLNNTSLVNIDISNSQPLIFSITLNQFVFLNSCNKALNRFKHCNDMSLVKSNCNIYNYTNYYDESFYSVKIKDVERYNSLVQEGKIYDFLMAETNKTNRNQFKRQFFAEVFYSTINTETELTKKFASIFPTVFKAIHHYKKNDYRNLPLAMQKAEADIMINDVSKNLTEQHIPFLTVHDSIMAPPEHVNIVKKHITQAFAKHNLYPTYN